MKKTVKLFYISIGLSFLHLSVLAQPNIPKPPLATCIDASTAKCEIITPQNLVNSWSFYYDTELSPWDNQHQNQLMCWEYSDITWSNSRFSAGPSFGYTPDGQPGKPAGNTIAVGSLDQTGLFKSGSSTALIGGREFATFGQCEWGVWRKNKTTNALALLFGAYTGRSADPTFIDKSSLKITDPSFVTSGTDLSGKTTWSLTRSESLLPNVINDCEDNNMLRMMVAYWTPLSDGSLDPTKVIIKPVFWKDSNGALNAQCMIVGTLTKSPSKMNVY
jgi:hypothetical protein